MTLTDTWIDKTEWGDGPWNDEPDRAEWVDAATGLTCLALRANPRMGNWCGYVAVPPGHAWHGKTYDDIDTDVHGGLTFSDSCMSDDRPLRERVCHTPRPGAPDDVWWLGFDCHHAWDIAPGFVARERALGFPPVPAPDGLFGGRRTYRTLDYVRAECERLAMQARDR